LILFLKNFLFTIVVPGTVALYLPLLLVQSRSLGSIGAMLLGLGLVTAGGGTYIWCVWDFATFGRGTPAPIDAPKKLVVRGLYRYTRNPMYVGVLTAIAGWAIAFQSLALVLYAVVVWAGFQGFIVLYEERHLRRAFGAEYEGYLQRVPRWLPLARRNPGA
jgi:protein-S-isoprenylcysteine O-methyltransferase Ste14